MELISIYFVGELWRINVWRMMLWGKLQCYQTRAEINAFKNFGMHGQIKFPVVTS